MKKIIFFIFINYIISPIPTWNFESVADNLLSFSDSDESTTPYVICDKNNYSPTGKMTRKIVRENGSVRYINYLKVGNDGEHEVGFNDIDSLYVSLGERSNYKTIICPQGKFHPYYYDGSGEFRKNYFENFGTDWEIKCYNHDTGYFLVFYFRNKYNSLYYIKNNEWKEAHISDELYDFKQLENGVKEKNSRYYFPYLAKKGSELYLFGGGLILNNDESNVNWSEDNWGKVKLADSKAFTSAYFDLNSDFYYFFTYDNASNFISGYNTEDFDSNGINNFNAKVLNEESPLEFIDEVEIIKMKFISNTKFVYYEIKNINNNKIYHGIIDIKLNKVIFNTDEVLTDFIPYDSISMLALTSNNAYRICPFKIDGVCVASCTNPEEYILDSHGNRCSDTCDGDKILLIPERFCNDTCDENYYVRKDNQCGLCKNLYPNEKIYKLINVQGCFETQPPNTIEHNLKLKLYKCKNGYKLDNNECVTNCYDLCKTCSDFSDDSNNQKCLECKDGYVYDNTTHNCNSIPTTVVTTKLTTILINPPTTTTTTIPIPLITTTPNPIITTAFTTIVTTIPNQILTTALTTIVTTIPTTIINIIPSTVITTIPTTVPVVIPKVVCPDEKCLTCNEVSNSLGLCLSCNEEKGYRKVNYTLVLTNFLDCIKPSNPSVKKYYYNETLQVYRPCYKTCKSCSKGGNAEENYCLECETDYMFRPGNNPYNNCVAFSEYYYISSYNQYKGLKIYQCPEEAKYYIIDKKSCIDDCKKDSEYKYLHNGHCFKECPSGTNSNSHNICIIDDNSKCILGKNEIFLSENDNLYIIDTLIKTYISEFDYTKRYVSIYENINYIIMIYKDINCIKELEIEMPNVEFQSCYTKVQNAYSITEELIIVIVDRKILESLSSKLSKNDTNYETQTSLTSQGINIFDLNDPFYTDICYDFDNPLKKDIPLNDRIKHIYPDIELCDEGCQYKGINLDDMTATCDCAFNDITNNNLIKDNALLEGAVGEIFDMINSSNILVFKCFKNIFKHFSRSIGGWISLGLIIAHISLSLTFFLVQSKMANKYIYDLTSEYISIINNSALAPPKRVKLLDNKNKNRINNINNNKNNNRNKQTTSQQVSQTNINNNKKLIINEIAKVSVDELIVPFKEENKLKTSENENFNNIGTSKNNEGDDQIFNNKFFEEYLSTSPDDMEFDDAVVKDKRKYCEHMKENLIEDQIITATFVSEDPLKPRTIKIMVFILNLVLYFVVNGLFFSEEVISDLYNVNEEDENFFSYLPRSINRLIYTTLVSVVVSIITDFFFIDEKKIKGIFRREKTNIKILKEKIKDIMNELKRRYIAFIIVVSMILILSFFYLLCFNYVYPYTQIEWIKSSITIMIIMQILSLLKCILETSLRYLSYKFKSEKLYKISKILD